MADELKLIAVSVVGIRHKVDALRGVEFATQPRRFLRYAAAVLGELVEIFGILAVFCPKVFYLVGQSAHGMGALSASLIKAQRSRA